MDLANQCVRWLFAAFGTGLSFGVIVLVARSGLISLRNGRG